MANSNESAAADYGEMNSGREFRLSSDALLPALAMVDGQPVNVSGISDTVDKIVHRLGGSSSFLVCTLNLDHLVKLRRDPAFVDAYAKAEIVTADGFPISALARLDGVRLERAPGCELVEPLCEVAAKQKLPVFLIGATLEALCLSAKRLVSSYPGLEICGVYAPPKNFDNYSKVADEAIEVIRDSGARICFVALGAPKQEVFAVRAIGETANTAFVGIGGSLDFLAGTQTRCPPMLRRMYLEWAWRLMLSPRRLGMRYLRCAVLFPVLLMQTVINRGPATKNRAR